MFSRPNVSIIKLTSFIFGFIISSSFVSPWNGLFWSAATFCKVSITFFKLLPAIDASGIFKPSISTAAALSAIPISAFAATPPNFVNASVKYGISCAPSFDAFAKISITFPAALAGNSNAFNVPVRFAIDVGTSSPEAFESIIAFSVKSAIAAPFFNSSGLAEPANLKAVAIFAALSPYFFEKSIAFSFKKSKSFPS